MWHYSASKTRRRCRLSLCLATKAGASRRAICSTPAFHQTHHRCACLHARSCIRARLCMPALIVSAQKRCRTGAHAATEGCCRVRMRGYAVPALGCGARASQEWLRLSRMNCAAGHGTNGKFLAHIAARKEEIAALTDEDASQKGTERAETDSTPKRLWLSLTGAHRARRTHPGAMRARQGPLRRFAAAPSTSSLTMSCAAQPRCAGSGGRSSRPRWA